MSMNKLRWGALLALLVGVSGVGIASAQVAAGAPRLMAPIDETATRGSALSALPVVRRSLPNGLRVVMSPQRDVPTVAVAVYYDVGSRNEAPGRTGFAHLFEHMMFQGSANVDKAEHFVLIQGRGGSANGTTSRDRTNYYETLPSNELALGLWLEDDRMRSLAITAENFENQRATVMEERRQRYDNQPYMQSYLRINELAYGSYFPYSHSTIGDMRDLERAPLSAVQEFFEQYYPPNNAVLSIAGDFDPEEAMRLVNRYFGAIPSREVPEYAPGPRAPQTARRHEVMVDPLAPQPGVHVAYPIPPSREADHYALELLALVLGDGDSSRLHQELVKDRRICTSVSVATDDMRGPDLFSFWMKMQGDHAPSEAVEAAEAALARIADRGITPRELQKVHNRVRSYFLFGMQSNLSRAQNLAEFEMYYGNAELLRTELDRYLAVTAGDIRRVAGTYFPRTAQTVLEVMPPPADSAPAASE